MKNKTLTTWITLLFGSLGLHRFYLYGSRDAIAWLMPIPTALGVYGFERVAEYGLDDVLSWWLLPLLG
ncbi:MAG: NINE protein, partial [Oxalobacteraceae bacterium]|nr:NINE protein [Oxalobacteraceae bacterium]